LDGSAVGLRQVRATCALLLVCAGGAGAQRALTVPASSPVYDRLESISALVPVKGLHLGMRPMSRQELSRVVGLLSQTLGLRADSSARTRWALRELDALRADLALEDAGDAWKTAASLNALSSDARADRIVPSVPEARLDAVYHPFAAERQGRATLDGTTMEAATTAAWSSDRVAVLVEPRATWTSPRGAPADFAGSMHRAYGRGVWRNVAFAVGSEERLLGQSPAGALLVSGHAAPYPSASLSNDTAFVLPWLFRLAGPVRLLIDVGDLGATQYHPHAKLATWQVSMQPWSRFELGVAVQTHVGGRGAPSGTVLQHVLELFPIIDALAPQHSDIQLGNKLAGGNLRLRFPEWSGLDVYMEMEIDDFDGRRLAGTIVDDTGYLWGLRLPLMLGGGQLAWRAEYHNTGIRMYGHPLEQSGITYRQRLIGDPLGPNANAGYLSVAWQRSPRRAASLALADEIRDPSQYTVTTTGPRDQGWKFERVSDDPRIRRRRAQLRWMTALPTGSLDLSLGVNRAWRTGDVPRNEWMGQLRFSTQRLPQF
jgi:hypothetical protein